MEDARRERPDAAAEKWAGPARDVPGLVERWSRRWLRVGAPPAGEEPGTPDVAQSGERSFADAGPAAAEA